MAQKLTPAIERALLARAKSGGSNRQLAAWLSEQHGVSVSHQTIGNLLNRATPRKGGEIKAPGKIRSANGKSRARPLSRAVPVLDRVAHIAKMMRALEWRRGDSVAALAEAWGLAVATVEGHSAEASRLVYAEIASPEAVSVKVCTALDRVIDDSLRDAAGAQIKSRDSSGDEVFLDYDPSKARKVVVDAARAWAEISGAKAASRVELSGSVSLEDLADLRKRIGRKG